MANDLLIWGATDRGRRHDTNDDALFPRGRWPAPYALLPQVTAQGGHLVAVADGVTNASFSELASQTAIDTLVSTYYETVLESPPEQALLEAAYRANAAARALVGDGTEADVLVATTLVAAVIYDGTVQVVHVGDSRAYLVTPEQITPLTVDHSLVQEMFDAGEITAAEALEHPDQGVLTRAIGVGEHVTVDLSVPHPFTAADMLMLCSDGLTTLVSEAEIASLVRRHHPHRAVKRLLALANQRGGYDNISVIVARQLPASSWWQRFIP